MTKCSACVFLLSGCVCYTLSTHHLWERVKAEYELRKPLPMALPSSWPHPLACRLAVQSSWLQEASDRKTLPQKKEQGKGETYLNFTVNCTPVFRTSGL